METKSLMIALVSGLMAGFMQLSTIFILGLKMRPAQIAGALFISMSFGFGVAQGAQVWFHLEPFFAGTVGALSGALPAVFVPLIITKRILKQLGMEGSDLSEMGKLAQEELK